MRVEISSENCWRCCRQSGTERIRLSSVDASPPVHRRKLGAKLSDRTMLCKDLTIFHDLFIGTSTMFDMLKWLKPICLFILFRRYFMAGWSMFEP